MDKKKTIFHASIITFLELKHLRCLKSLRTKGQSLKDLKLCKTPVLVKLLF